MESDETRRARPEGEETGDREDAFPTGDESPLRVGGTVVRGLFGVLFGRFLFLNALVWLVLGAGLLTGSWTMVRGELDRREALEAFTGRAPGVVEAPWWRLDFDPEVLGDGTHWLAVTEASACARLRFRPEGGEETVTAFCRRHRGGVRNAYFFTWEEALGPEPVRWVDGHGMPRLELRVDSELVRWLDERGAEVHSPFYDPETFHGPERAQRADRLLGEVWRDLDDPFLRLLEEWSKPPPEVTVAYPPGDPAMAVPRVLLEEDRTADSSGAGWWLAVPLGLFGLLAWGAGCHLLTGQRGWFTLGLVATGLAVLPWAADHAGELVGRLSSDAELGFRFIETEMIPLPPELALAVAASDSSEGYEIFAWTLERSTYAPLLRWIEVTPPPAPMDSDGVLRHLADQVRSQAAALPDEELAALLDWVTEVQERGQGEELGLLFVDAALALRGDPDRSREVRWSADDLLTAIALHPPSDNPYRLAVEERQRILARLPAGR